MRDFAEVTNAPYRVKWVTPGFGDYSITAFANVDSGPFRVASLPVTVPVVPELGFPRVIRPPQKQTCPLGGNITLTGVADGQAPLNYQWRLNCNSISGATHATLSITNVQPENSGLYAVVVQNRLGAVASSPAFLAVNYTNAGWVLFQNLSSTLNAPVRDTGTQQGLTGTRHVELRAGLRPDQLFSTSSPKLVGFNSGSRHRQIFPPGLR